MMKVRTTLTAIAVALALVVLAACAEDTGTSGSGSGAVALRVSGEGAAKVGYPYEKNGHMLAFADGWKVTFSKFVISLGQMRLRASDGKIAFESSEIYVADLHKGDAAIATYRDLAVRRWDRFDFRILPPTREVVNLNGVATEDVETMIREGYNYWIEGAAEKGGRSYSFHWGLRNATQNSNCTNGIDGTDGFVVTNNTVTSAEVTVHVDHLFWDSLGSEVATMRFDAIAAAAGGDREIRFDELASQSLTDLKAEGGAPLTDEGGKPIRYNAGSVPLASPTLESFVLASAATQAHVNGLGLCTVKSLPRGGPPAPTDAGQGDASHAEACPSTEDYAVLEEHSCFHRTNGPRRTVQAAQTGGAPVDVSFSHTEVTVVLPSSNGGYAGVVHYTARKSRPYMIYSDIDPKIAVTARDGRAIAPVCGGGSIGKCAGLTRAAKFSLTEGETYAIAMGPVAGPEVVLVIEEIDFEDP